MRKNLTVIGNSLGIITEKPIPDLLGINRETQLEIITAGQRLIIKTVKEENRTAKNQNCYASRDKKSRQNFV